MEGGVGVKKQYGSNTRFAWISHFAMSEEHFRDQQIDNQITIYTIDVSKWNTTI